MEDVALLTKMLSQEKDTTLELTKRTTELRTVIWDIQKRVTALAEELRPTFPQLADRVLETING